MANVQPPEREVNVLKIQDDHSAGLALEKHAEKRYHGENKHFPIMKKRREIENDIGDKFKKQCRALTDPILDEVSKEVAEELDWALVLERWNVESENMSNLILT